LLWRQEARICEGGGDEGGGGDQGAGWVVTELEGCVLIGYWHGDWHGEGGLWDCGLVERQEEGGA